MHSILDGLFVVGLAVATAYVVNLANRVRNLERHLGSDSKDVVDLVNKMTTAILRPSAKEAEHLKAHDKHDALRLIDHYVGERISGHIPALRRIWKVTIGLNRSFLLERAGITAEDLVGQELHLSEVSLHPGSELRIEEWATHTVASYINGPKDLKTYIEENRRVFYDGDEGWPQYPAIVVWAHRIPSANKTDSWFGGTLEVVIHGGRLKVWAIGGRFGTGRLPEWVAEEKHVFASIPMNEKDLGGYRVSEVTDDPEITVGRRPWVTHYSHGEAGDPVWWSVTHHDIVAYVRR